MSAPNHAVKPGRVGSGIRLLSALAILIGGALHVRLAYDAYGTSDLITLFFLNGIGSACVAAWILYDRQPFSILAGLGVSAVSLVAFALSRMGDGVVGFRGVGLDPSPDAALVLGVEAVAMILLLVAVANARGEIATIAKQLRR